MKECKGLYSMKTLALIEFYKSKVMSRLLINIYTLLIKNVELRPFKDFSFELTIY